MINFITLSQHNCYWNVILQFIRNIAKHDEANCQVSDRSQPGMINVHFFLEKKVLDVVGLKGISVFVCHGIADKRYRIIRQLQQFDYIIATGPTWYDKLVTLGIPKEKLFVGGYVKMDHLFGITATPKHVLWAPSHNVYKLSTKLSSYPALQDWCDANNIVQSKHPANNEAHAFTDKLLTESTAVIADVGSTVYEAWALDIPVVFPSWLLKDGVKKFFYATLESYIYENSIDYHVANIDALGHSVRTASAKGITKQAVELIEGIFPRSLRGNSGKTTYDILKKLEVKL